MGGTRGRSSPAGVCMTRSPSALARRGSVRLIAAVARRLTGPLAGGGPPRSVCLMLSHCDNSLAATRSSKLASAFLCPPAPFSPSAFSIDFHSSLSRSPSSFVSYRSSSVADQRSSGVNPWRTGTRSRSENPGTGGKLSTAPKPGTWDDVRRSNNCSDDAV